MFALKKTLFVAALAAAALAAPLADANTNWSVGINIGPPPLRYEPVPVVRVGYVWTPGYWEWRNNRHVWIGGRYLPERRNHHYVTSRWDERGGRWYYSPGRWDSDRDGVPDRYDRHPNNPYRR